MKRERCPFCGKQPRVCSSEDTTMHMIYWVECDCGVRMGTPRGWDFLRSEDQAIERWNRRITPRTMVQKTVHMIRGAELREMLERVVPVHKGNEAYNDSYSVVVRDNWRSNSALPEEGK